MKLVEIFVRFCDDFSTTIRIRQLYLSRGVPETLPQMTNAAAMGAPASFSVGDWRVVPASGRLERDGVEVKLEPKVMNLLVCLADQPGQVVSREVLEDKVWAGIPVGYNAISGSVIKLRKALGDDTRRPRYIETVSKRGYRLIAPVSRGGGKPEAAAVAKPAAEAGAPALRDGRRTLLAAGVGMAAAAAVLLYLAIWRDSATETPPIAAASPSIVVLPFKNLDGDPAQERLSEGITDDLITDLSKVASLRVIARQSSYFYRDNPAAFDEVAQQLAVSYLVDGSLQREGKRIRINVQLISAEKGESIWADRFDTDTDNVFKVQDTIARKVISAMTLTLSNRESGFIKMRGTRDFEAYDAFLIGQQQIRTRSKQGYQLSLEAYRRAIEIDPNYARAYSGMAVALTHGYRYQWSDLTLVEARERALKMARKAVALNQSTPQIYWALGFVHVHRHEYEAAETAAEQSIALSPNYADGHALLAYIANWRGKPEEAVRHVQQAAALNPFHTFEYPSIVGLAYYNLGRYEDAATALRDSLDRNESALNPRLFLAAAYVRLNRLDEAEWEIERIKVNRPDATIEGLATILPYERDALLAPLREDLRKAGLPE